MIAKAKVRFVRIAPRKVRLVTSLIKGKSVQEALAFLSGTHKRAAQVVDKLLRSAVANAKQKGFENENLFISKVYADDGVTWKRSRAASFGRANRINKRTAHITVELDRKETVNKVTPPLKTLHKEKEIKKVVVKKKKVAVRKAKADKVRR
ncbi:MAG: 50S ribosomal protein L22 [Candidatus Omnitrophica bacterium]|nr:50S ribosomal protein L22 [Candidatus Omnitrophota bacterium]